MKETYYCLNVVDIDIPGIDMRFSTLKNNSENNNENITYIIAITV